MMKTPKLDAEVDRVNRERAELGLGPLSRAKAVAQIAAESIIVDAVARGMTPTSSCVEMYAWIILEPVIEDRGHEVANETTAPAAD